jgi:hypothetical protein
MNRIERPFAAGVEARVVYQQTEYKVVRHGTFVRCAATGAPIPLDDLKYWSVERQEAYASPAAIQQRIAQLRQG